MSSYYFSCSGGASTYSTKSTRTSYDEFVFLHPEGSMGHIVHSGATEVRNGVGTIFHAWVGPVWIRQKAHRDTLRFSCVFTSCGICGSYSAFRCIWGAKCQLIFMLRWARCGLHKKPTGTRYTQLVFFASCGMCGSCSAFWCIWGTKRRRIFMLRWARCGLYKKCARTRYAQLVFLQHVGWAGHVVHFGASGVQNVIAAFSCSGGTGSDSTKSALGHVMPNLCFCICWDMRVT
jgi:hypothetical protein